MRALDQGDNSLAANPSSLQPQPLSTGGPSEGTRLLLGTNITRVQAALVKDPNSADMASDQKLVNTPTLTQYLLAAGAKAFDPNCASPSLSQAKAAGCSVLGRFNDSCGTGCGLDPLQEQLWANASGGYFGSYPTALWVPAGATVWQPLRGTLTNMIPATATGAAADTMALLSDPASIINKGTYAVSFNMTDRTYWIINGTATANMRQIMMGTYLVTLTSFLQTHVMSVVLKGDPWPWGPMLSNNTQSPSPDSSGAMSFQPIITFPGAQCFAASNPIDNNGEIGRGSGTSGASRRTCVYGRLCAGDGRL